MSLKQICFYTILTFGIISICSNQTVQSQTDNVDTDTLTQQKSHHQDLLSNNTLNQTQATVTQQQSPQNTETNTSSSQSIPVPVQIYGVRWSVGSHFIPEILVKPVSSHYYTLAFNADFYYQDPIFVEIQSTVHSCSSKKVSIEYDDSHHPPVQRSEDYKGQTLVSYVYRCNINKDIGAQKQQSGEYQLKRQTSQYEYTIFYQEVQHAYRKNPKSRDQSLQKDILHRKVNITRNQLFKAKFRPLNNLDISPQSVLIFGDWGIISEQVQKAKKYTPVLQSMITALKDNQNIRLSLFLGDLAYDFAGQKFKETLIYIQAITSVICFMVTPGNHDNVYHLDSAQLFTETFFSPQWEISYNYYYAFAWGNTLFISYSPENMVDGEKQEIDVRPFSWMESLVNIQGRYHVVVFSHYPIFCSKMNDDLEACTKSKFTLKKYLQIFQGAGMNLYFSGHLHYYERTHQICWDSVKNNLTYFVPQQVQYLQGTTIKQQFYSDSCPIFVVEGVAGNQYFEEEDGAINIQKISSKVSQKAGFGILQIGNKNEQDEDIMQFAHYQVVAISQAKIGDKFIKRLPKLTKTATEQVRTNIHIKISEMVIIVVLLATGSITCFLMGKRLIKDGHSDGRDKQVGTHAQMVQQNLNSVISYGAAPNSSGSQPNLN